MSEHISHLIRPQKARRAILGSPSVPFHPTDSFSPYPKAFPHAHEPFLTAMLGKKSEIYYKTKVDEFFNRGTWLVAESSDNGKNRNHFRSVALLFDENHKVNEMEVVHDDIKITINDSAITGQVGMHSSTLWQIAIHNGKPEYRFKLHGQYEKTSFSELTSAELKELKAAGFDPGLVLVMDSFKNGHTPMQRKSMREALMWEGGIAAVLAIQLASNANSGELSSLSALTLPATLAMLNNFFITLSGQMDANKLESKIAFQSGNIGFMLASIGHWLGRVPNFLIDETAIVWNVLLDKKRRAERQKHSF